ncbi:MAG: hypothetical protein ACR2PZ_17545 [Pseudomonadales bacterium]
MSRYLPGDVVSRRKGPVMHRGVVLGDGRVLHNTPSRGEHISSMLEFSAGQKVRVQRRSRTERERALSHAERGRHQPYHLLRNNCEHTVSRAHTGRSRSPQLAGWLLGLGLAGATLAVTRHPGLSAAGFALGQRLGGRATR